MVERDALKSKSAQTYKFDKVATAETGAEGSPREVGCEVRGHFLDVPCDKIELLIPRISPFAGSCGISV